MPVFSHRRSPVKAASASLAEATRTGRDVVIVDTAGRLAIDAEMMDQVRRISVAVKPDYTFLVVDATAGQDAVNAARSFHDTLGIDGVILTKLDGDARGGAALSVKEVVGRPIAFASVGEKLEDFEPFHPDRLASRILGMGDVETLIDKAEATFEAEQAEETATRLLEGTFTFDDFLSTMQQVLGMGNLRSLIGMMPGVPRELRGADIDESRITRITGMIHSMTPAERSDPDIIKRLAPPAHRGRLGLPPGRCQGPGRSVQADAVHDARPRVVRWEACRGRVEGRIVQAVGAVETEVGLPAARRRTHYAEGSPCRCPRRPCPSQGWKRVTGPGSIDQTSDRLVDPRTHIGRQVTPHADGQEEASPPTAWLPPTLAPPATGDSSRSSGSTSPADPAGSLRGADRQ